MIVRETFPSIFVVEPPDFKKIGRFRQKKVLEHLYFGKIKMFEHQNGFEGLSRLIQIKYTTGVPRLFLEKWRRNYKWLLFTMILC